MFSTDNFKFFDLYSSEFAVGMSALLGYNFGKIFADLGAFSGYGRVTARENSTWLFQNSPIVKSGDALANNFSFGFSPGIGTHINTGNSIFVPKVSLPLSWLRSTATEGANRQLSADLSNQISGVAQMDLIDNTIIKVFRVSIQTGFSILFEKFYIDLVFDVPLVINSELKIDFVDNDTLIESSSGSKDASTSIGFGFRF